MLKFHPDAKLNGLCKKTKQAIKKKCLVKLVNPYFLKYEAILAKKLEQTAKMDSLSLSLYLPHKHTCTHTKNFSSDHY